MPYSGLSISSILHYCMGLYVPQNLNRVVLLQKRAVRIVSKEAFDAHTDPVFKVLKILKFEKNKFIAPRKINVFI